MNLWHLIIFFQALTVLGAQREKDLAAKREYEVELSKVSIKKDDVELIVSCLPFTFTHITIKRVWNYNLFILLQVKEMEITRSLAERKLREHRGNVVEALQSLTD